MPAEKVDLNRFIITLSESPKRWIHQATDGLTDEQLYRQPSSDTNSVAWLIWHLSRWRDKISASIVSESQVWVSQGWAGKFGMEPKRTGMGDTSEQVTSFRPSRELLLGYAEATHEALVTRVANMTQEDFQKEIDYTSDSTRPAWQALVSVMADSSEHSGQINYLRGWMTGKGWR